MTHSSTRDQLQKLVSNPNQKGLTKEQMDNSHLAIVESCDDLFNIYIEIKDETIVVARFEGNGCAISAGAIEAILSLIEGKKINEVNDIINIYEKYLKGETDEIDPSLKVFEIVQSHVSRRKCALAPIGAIRKVIKNG